MPQEPNETPVVPAEDPATPETKSETRRKAIQTAAPVPPKKRTPAPKPRSLAELDALDPKKMTPAESVLYINTLREFIMRNNNQCNAYQESAKSAFDQFRNADAAYKAKCAEYDRDMALAKQIIDTAQKSLTLIGGNK
jgi:hypothetical protein